MSEINPFHLTDTFIALDDSGGAKPLQITIEFWDALQQGRLGTFSRLVSFLTFEQD